MPIRVVAPRVAAGILAFLAITAAAPSYAQQVLPPPLRGGQPSDVPIALQIARFRMLDGDINALTFHSMDSLFTTRTVARSGPVWALPRADHALDFTYRYK